MTQPSVNITELDGALGVIPSSAGKLTAFIGCATGGPLNLPAAFARVTDLVASFLGGELVEAAASYIYTTGRPALVVRAAGSTAPVLGVVTPTMTGTSIVTVAVPSGGAGPVDHYEMRVKFPTGGTVGTAGIVYQVSFDGGRNYGLKTELGTLNKIAVGGVEFSLGVGTIVAGDAFACVVHPAQWSGVELQAALTALGQSAVQWEQLSIVGTLDATTAGTVDTWCAGIRNSQHKYRSWIGAARVSNRDDPAAIESEAAYLTAMTGVWSGFASTRAAISGGACRLTSGVNGRNYRRPVSWPLVNAQGAVTEEVNVADPNLGALPGVTIRDPNGNVDEHDESINPGLDDIGLTVLRTWDGYSGTYVNRPLLKSNPGSDYTIIPYRRVMNLAEVVAYQYFVLRLNKPIRVDPTTGYILETEALEIEAGANAVLIGALLTKPKASSVSFVLSRTDNVLSTKTLTGSIRLTPLAYPETINLDTSYFNPALVTKAA
jgi:hypothetical protein